MKQEKRHDKYKLDLTHEVKDRISRRTKTRNNWEQENLLKLLRRGYRTVVGGLTYRTTPKFKA